MAEVVQARRLALNKCIQKTANHPGLCHDKDLQLFLESDNFSLDVRLFLFDVPYFADEDAVTDQTPTDRRGRRAVVISQ